MLIPHLDLSYGQMAWSLCLGQEPTKQVLDHLNYLRQLGIPFEAGENASGRGNRVRYQFDHLVECGVGLYALRQGFRPADVKKVLVDNRKAMREAYREALKAQPEAALTSDWVKSRGSVVPGFGSDERWLRLHDRFSEKPGTFEYRGMEELPDQKGTTPFDMVERYPGERARELVPLTRLVVQWVAWALEAPVIKTGPKS